VTTIGKSEEAHEILPLPPPLCKNLLGITRAKKEVKKELGVTEAMKPFRWWTNTKRRFKRKIRYESEGAVDTE
jgi:hypothetical protein